MKPATRMTLFAVVVLAAILLWSTMQAQKAACTVCVSYKGAHNCARATAETEKEAAKSAQTTACGPVARGMDQSIECDNTPRVVVHCTT
jgi:ABC-type sugar transport system substrate-binding protein